MLDDTTSKSIVRFLHHWHSKNSFVIQCDYRHTENNNLEYLIPSIVDMPEILFDVKLIPNKIEFLIKK